MSSSGAEATAKAMMVRNKRVRIEKGRLNCGSMREQMGLWLLQMGRAVSKQQPGRMVEEMHGVHLFYLAGEHLVLFYCLPQLGGGGQLRRQC